MAKRFAFGPFLLDTARGTLTRDGAALAVGQRGLRILQALLEARGAPVSKDALMSFAWPGLVVEDSNLSVQVAALRRLLATADRPGAEWIVTVQRLGYHLPDLAAVEETQLAPIDHGAPDPGGRPGTLRRHQRVTTSHHRGRPQPSAAGRRGSARGPRRARRGPRLARGG